MKPLWQYFALLENPKFVGDAQTRLIAVILFTIATVISTTMMIVFALRLKQQTGVTGSSTKKYYYLQILSIWFILLNSYFIRLSLFITDGRWVVFSREKGVLFVIGAIFFMIAIKNICFDIIDFSSMGKFLVLIPYYALLLNGVVLFSIQTAFIFDISSFGNQTLFLIQVTGLISVSLLIIFVIILFREMISDPSKIEKLRLGLLSFTLIAMTIELILIAYGSALKNTGDVAFVTYSTWYLPITYLILHPLIILSLYYSLFTPNWLLVKTGIIQPSFSEFLSKRGSGN